MVYCQKHDRNFDISPFIGYTTGILVLGITIPYIWKNVSNIISGYIETYKTGISVYHSPKTSDVVDGVRFHPIPLFHNLSLARHFIKNPVNLMSIVHNTTSAPISKFSLFGKDLYYIHSLEEYENYFIADKDLDQTKIYGFMTYVFGKRVVYDVDEITRRNQFMALRQQLNTKTFEVYVTVVDMEVRAKIAETTKNRELLDFTKTCIIQTSTHCIMGPDILARLQNSEKHLLIDLEEGISPLGVIAPWLPTMRHRRRDAARRMLANTFSEILKIRKEEIRSNNLTQADVYDLMSKMILAQYPDGTYYDDEEITGLCIAGYFGGMHNSSISSFWIVFLVFTSPVLRTALYLEQLKIMQGKWVSTEESSSKSKDLEIETIINNLCQPRNNEPECIKRNKYLSSYTPEGKAKLTEYAEQIRAILKDKPSSSSSVASQPVTYDQMMEMPLLKAVIYETLRLFPPLVLLMRTVEEPYMSGTNKLIKPGSVLVVSPKLAHRDPNWFEDPDTFNYSRFLDEKNSFTLNNIKGRSYMAFGHGRRRCIGEHFGILQVNVAVAVFLRSVDFNITCELPEHALTEQLVAGPVNDISTTLNTSWSSIDIEE